LVATQSNKECVPPFFETPVDFVDSANILDTKTAPTLFRSCRHLRRHLIRRKQLKDCSAIREDVTRSSKVPKIDRKLLDRLARRRPKHSFNNMPGRSKSLHRIPGCGAENMFSRDENTEFSPFRFAF
jgi:hypothetical protein